MGDGALRVNAPKSGPNWRHGDLEWEKLRASEAPVLPQCNSKSAAGQ